MHWYHQEKLLRKSRSNGRSMLLPSLVLVRVCVVADTSDNDARKVVHQSRRLHFEAEYASTQSLVDLVSEGCILDHLVTGRDQAVVYTHFTSLSLDDLGPIAVSATSFFLLVLLFTVPI